MREGHSKAECIVQHPIVGSVPRVCRAAAGAGVREGGRQGACPSSSSLHRRHSQCLPVHAAGLLQVLACVKAAGKGAPRVHVYGFNWSGKHWLTHQVCPRDWFEERSPSDAQLLNRHCWLWLKLSKPECRWARRLCGTWLNLAGTAPRVGILPSPTCGSLQMGAEETIVRFLVEPFSVEFHATACGGLRACKAACDTESFQISEAGDGEECRKRCAALGKFMRGSHTSSVYLQQSARKWCGREDASVLFAIPASTSIRAKHWRFALMPAVADEALKRSHVNICCRAEERQAAQEMEQPRSACGLCGHVGGLLLPSIADMTALL